MLLDWLSITSKIHSPYDFIDLLGMKDCSWEEIPGANGYHDRLYYDHCSIHYNGREGMGVWLELSGQGCRAFESLGHGVYDVLFNEVLSEPDQMNVTRLDIAYDDHTGVLDMSQLMADTMNVGIDRKPLEIVSKFQERRVTWDHKDDLFPAVSIEHGRKSSETMIRIYDKALERGYVDGRHWVRLELQLRKDRAFQAVQRLAGGEAVGPLMLGIVYNYLRYVDDPGTDCNRWRWPMKSYWSELLAGIEKISLYQRPGKEYNVLNLEDYVLGQAGNAIAAYVEMLGWSTLQKAVRKKSAMLPAKYKQLIREYEEERRKSRARYGIEPGQQNKNSSDGT